MTKFFVSALLFTTLSSTEVFAGLAPEISIGIASGTSVGSDSKFGGIDPIVQWTSSGEFGGCDVQGGLAAVVTNNVNTMPLNLWGKIKKTDVAGYDLSARLSVPNIRKPSAADVDIVAMGKSDSLEMKGAIPLQESAEDSSPSSIISLVRLQKKIPNFGGGLLKLTPKYVVQKKQMDLTVQYTGNEKLGADIQIDSNAIFSSKKTKLTIQRALNSRSRIRPSITTEKQVSIDYEYDVDDTTKITTTLAPNDYINLKWEDGPWAANIKAPMDGFGKFNEGLKVGIKRTVQVM